MSPDYVPSLLNRRAAAAMLGISVGTLVTWRKRGRGPRPLRLTPGPRGRCVYRREDVEAFARDPELVAGWPLVKFDRPMMSRHTAP